MTKENKIEKKQKKLLFYLTLAVFIFLVFYLGTSILSRIQQKTSPSASTQEEAFQPQKESEAQLVTLSGFVTETSGQTMVVSLNEYGSNSQKKVSVIMGEGSVVHSNDDQIVEFSKIKKGDYVSIVLEAPVFESLLENMQLRAKDIYISEVPENI